MMEFEVVENTEKAFCTVNRLEIDGIKIAEVYWHEGDSIELDYVLMFFGYNKESLNQISELIKEYHVKKANCTIGCNDLAGEVIDFTDNDENETFSSLMKQFDLHLDSATPGVFENLVEFCTSTETDGPTIMPHDFKSNQGTEIHIVTEESNSIKELKKLVSESCKKLFSHREQKFPKVMIAFLTNGYELRLDKVKELFDSLGGFITGDSCMMVLNNKISGQNKEVIKVSLIFCEG